MNLKEKILSDMDIAEYYSDLFPEWEPGKNISCPFASERHEKGSDAGPSMSLSEKESGPVFCHACGYKASSPIGLLEDMDKISFEAACVKLYDEIVEPLVPASYLKEAHKELIGNQILLARLLVNRGITKNTLKKYNIGWANSRIIIPIKNQYGMVIDARKYDLLKKSPPGMKVISYKKGYGGARLWPIVSKKEVAIFLFEGEMDTLLALQDGIPATTITSGINTWKEIWSKKFKGKHVVIVADVDQIGLEGAGKRAASIAKFAKSAKILKLPLKGTKDENDYTDWVTKKGGTGKKLLKLAEALIAQPITKKAEASPVDAFDDMTNAEEKNLARGEGAFDYMSSKGAFFKNQDNELWYTQESRAPFRINVKAEQFLSYLSTKISPLINSATSSGKFVIQHVINQSLMVCTKSKSAAWSIYENGILYFCTGGAYIVKAEKGKLTKIKNAVNDDAILLETPPESIAYEADVEVEIAEAVGLFWKFIMQPMAVSVLNKYLIASWLLLIFLKDYMRVKPLIRLMASTAMGKSTATKIISLLIFGEENLQHSATTKAATYTLASKNPILLFDNMESRNIGQEQEDFLLTSSTGGQRVKRQLSTDSGLINDKSKCLVLTNGIEPLSKHEMISRTIEIPVDITRFGDKNFQELKLFQAIKKHRGKILCGLGKLISLHVIPRIKQGEIQRIAKEFPAHSMSRFNEALALMSIILDAIWAYLPCKEYGLPHQMVADWLETQTDSSTEQDEGTNEALYFMEEFAQRRPQLVDALTSVEEKDGYLNVWGTTRELFTDFRLLARHLSMKFPWQNERHLGTRLQDSSAILRKAGWVKRTRRAGGKNIHEYKRKIKKG